VNVAVAQEDCKPVPGVCLKEADLPAVTTLNGAPVEKEKANPTKPCDEEDTTKIRLCYKRDCTGCVPEDPVWATGGYTQKNECSPKKKENYKVYCTPTPVDGAKTKCTKAFCAPPEIVSSNLVRAEKDEDPCTDKDKKYGWVGWCWKQTDVSQEQPQEQPQGPASQRIGSAVYCPNDEGQIQKVTILYKTQKPKTIWVSFKNGKQIPYTPTEMNTKCTLKGSKELVGNWILCEAGEFHEDFFKVTAFDENNKVYVVQAKGGTDLYEMTSQQMDDSACQPISIPDSLT